MFTCYTSSNYYNIFAHYLVSWNALFWDLLSLGDKTNTKNSGIFYWKRETKKKMHWLTKVYLKLKFISALHVISVKRNAIPGSVNLMGERMAEKGKNNETTVHLPKD